MLGKHTDLGSIAKILEETKLPIIALGLGAQADKLGDEIQLTEGTRRWLDVIAAHSPSSAPNIGVRGSYTLEQIRNLGHSDRATIIGCPSILTNPDPELGNRITANKQRGIPQRVAVPAGMCHWPQLMILERLLTQMVQETDGIYIAQHDIDMVRACRGEFALISPEILSHMQRYLRPKSSMTEFKKWMRRYGSVFIDAGSWLEAMRGFDFVVGPRFHGVMLGIQAGTPGGVIAHDSRTVEMCRTMRIPYQEFSEITDELCIENLHSMFSFDQVEFDANRVELCRNYASILEGANLSVPTEFRILLSGSGR